MFVAFFRLIYILRNTEKFNNLSRNNSLKIVKNLYKKTIFLHLLNIFKENQLLKMTNYLKITAILSFIGLLPFIALFVIRNFPYEISCELESHQLTSSYYSSTGFLYKNTFRLSNGKTCKLFSTSEPFYDKDYSCIFIPIQEICDYIDLRSNTITGIFTVIIILCCYFLAVFLIKK